MQAVRARARAAAAILFAACASSGHAQPHALDLLARLQEPARVSVAIERPALLIVTPAGQAIQRMIQQAGLTGVTVAAWSGLAAALRLNELEAFQALFGGRVALALNDGNEWLFVTEIDRTTERLLIGRLGAAPREMIAGRTVFTLEDGAYRAAVVQREGPPAGGRARDRRFLLAPQGAGDLLKSYLESRAPWLEPGWNGHGEQPAPARPEGDIVAVVRVDAPEVGPAGGGLDRRSEPVTLGVTLRGSACRLELNTPAPKDPDPAGRHWPDWITTAAEDEDVAFVSLGPVPPATAGNDEVIAGVDLARRAGQPGGLLSDLADVVMTGLGSYEPIRVFAGGGIGAVILSTPEPEGQHRPWSIVMAAELPAEPGAFAEADEIVKRAAEGFAAPGVGDPGFEGAFPLLDRERLIELDTERAGLLRTVFGSKLRLRWSYRQAGESPWLLFRASSSQDPALEAGETRGDLAPDGPGEVSTGLVRPRMLIDRLGVADRLDAPGLLAFREIEHVGWRSWLEAQGERMRIRVDVEFAAGVADDD